MNVEPGTLHVATCTCAVYLLFVHVQTQEIIVVIVQRNSYITRYTIIHGIDTKT